MKIQSKHILYPAKDEVFGVDSPWVLIGQEADGWVISDAVLTDNNTMLITFEREVPDVDIELFNAERFLSGTRAGKTPNINRKAGS